MKIRFVKPEAGDPNRDRGIQVPYAPAKRQLARWRWYLILLVVSSPFLFFVGHFTYGELVVSAPGFISQEQITLRAGGQGTVDEVYVKALDRVQEGQPVARLANVDLSARAAQLRAELAQLQGVKHSSSREVPQGPSPTSMQDGLQSAIAQRDALGDRVKMLHELVNEGAATEGELTAAESQHSQAVGRVDEIYRVIDTPPAGSSPAIGLEIQTRVATVQSELASVAAQLDALLVRAPKTGRIVDLPVVKGDQLAVGGKLAMLEPDGGELHIDAYIPPRDAVYAVVGTHASVRFPDGSHRPAVVTDVPQLAAEVPRAQNALSGDTPVGVLVRMQFTDARSTAQRQLSDNLPVDVQFRNGWDAGGVGTLTARLHDYWKDLRERNAARRPNHDSNQAG